MNLDELEELKKKFVEAMQEKGIYIEIGGCGCCGSPWVTLQIDGEVIVDCADDFNITKDDYNDV